MKRFIPLLIITALLVSILLPSVAMAYSFGGENYNDNDYGKLRAFLEQESAEPGLKNGEQINAAYDPDDPTTWIGVTWDSSAVKQVRKIGDSYAWNDKSLAGTLDVSECAGLQEIAVPTNQISAINVQGAAALTTLYCSNNELSVLDVSTNTELLSLVCSNNNLTELDVSLNTKLTQINCNNNNVAKLDVSSNTDMLYLQCNNNQLTELDASASINIQLLFCLGNPLMSIKVCVGGGNILLAADGSGYLDYMLDLSMGIHFSSAVPAAPADFIGWSPGAELVDEETAYLSASKDYNLTAYFENAVTFERNGGDTDADPKIIAALDESTVNAPATAPTRAGFVFDGWYKEAGCTNAWRFDTGTVTDNTVLYAKWVPELTLTVSPASGTIYENGRLTITPNVPGGTWAFDVKVLSCELSGDNAVFTGKKAGTTNVTYTAGAQVETLDITVKTSLTLIVSQKAGTIYENGRLTITPNIAGGTWTYDQTYLSMETTADGAVFTGKKAGTTYVTYSVDTQTETFNITVEQTKLPKTGQDFTLMWVLTVVAVLVVCAGMSPKCRKKSMKE